MVKIIMAAMSVIFAISLVGLAQWPIPGPQATYLGKHEPLKIGTQCAESSSLIYIAEDRGFFAGNGLFATIKDGYSSGPEAIAGMEKGDVDISVSAEYPIVITALKKDNISIIACIDKYEGTYLIASRDSGSKNAIDLKGKKIGLMRGTEPEFYLGRYLELRSMSLHDVTLVHDEPSHFAAALADGRIDAFVSGYENVIQAQRLLGYKIITCPLQNGQTAFAVMACRKNWTKRHPELMEKLLKSLAQAEEYCIVNPNIARAIIQKRLNRDDKHISAVWPMHRLSLSFDQSLVTAMEDEGRWLIKNNLTGEKTIPDFRDYICTECLEKIKPESVKIW